MSHAQAKWRLYTVYAGWGVLAILFLSALAVSRTDTASAAGSMDLTGYAWSDAPTGNPSDRGVGWIHFKGTNYGVVEETTTGNLSGSAWSENIGWISFNRSETGNPPASDIGSGSGAIAAVNLSTGAVSGWARALAGAQAGSGGWDGWIHLSNGGTYSVTQNTTTCVWSGWAWGGSIMGWIHMSDPGYGVTGTAGGCIVVPPTAPTATLASSNYALTSPGGPVTLTWSSTNATSCGNITSQPARADTPISTGGATNNAVGVTANVPDTTIYTITCTGAGGSTNGVATIVVSSPVIAISNFQALPSRVAKGDRAYLLWTSTNMTSCTVKDADNNNISVPSPSTSSSGTQTPVTVTKAMTYTLTCTNSSTSQSETASVNLVPAFREI